MAARPEIIIWNNIIVKGAKFRLYRKRKITSVYEEYRILLLSYQRPVPSANE
ncbi:hypothetical protein GCM10027443_13990 [Pontibacter brevis]